MLLRRSVQVSSAFGVSGHAFFLSYRNAVNCAGVSEHVIKVMRHSHVSAWVWVTEHMHNKHVKIVKNTYLYENVHLEALQPGEIFKFIQTQNIKYY